MGNGAMRDKILIPSFPFSSFAKAAKLEKGMPFVALDSPSSCQRHSSPQSGFGDCGEGSGVRILNLVPALRVQSDAYSAWLIL
jgi:hypothetical protein